MGDLYVKSDRFEDHKINKTVVSGFLFGLETFILVFKKTNANNKISWPEMETNP